MSSSYFFGFSTSQTAALIALLAVAIPIAIHLFNRSRGKLVWIANIQLIQPAKLKRVTQIKLTQWLLLLLRFLILVVAALLLAGLFKENQLINSKGTQVLITPKWIFESNQADRDRLIENHPDAALNLLDKNFTSINLPLNEETLNKLNEAYSGEPHNIFARLLEFERLGQVKENSFVYAASNALAFEPSMPRLSQSYDWKIKANAAELSDQANDPIKVRILYSKYRAIDFQYLSHALNYWKQVNPNSLLIDSQLIDLSVVDTQGDLNNLADLDWVILLTDNELPDWISQWQLAGGYLLTDINGEAKERNKLAISDGELINIFQSSKIKNTEFFEVLLSSSNEPLLVETAPRHWQWASRFHPEWSNWVEKQGFPMEFAKLLSRCKIPQATNEVNSQQLNALFSQKYMLNEADKQTWNPPLAQTDLRNWLLICLCLLWFLERLLAEFKSAAPASGVKDD